jgi:hypothetical protein
VRLCHELREDAVETARKEAIEAQVHTQTTHTAHREHTEEGTWDTKRDGDGGMQRDRQGEGVVVGIDSTTGWTFFLCV